MNESKPSRLKPVASLSRHRSCVVGPLARSGGDLFLVSTDGGTDVCDQRQASSRHLAPEASGVPVPVRRHVRRVPLSLAFKAYRLPHPGQPPFLARSSGRGRVVRRPVGARSRPVGQLPVRCALRVQARALYPLYGALPAPRTRTPTPLGDRPRTVSR
jgi:hypothetical protein